MALAVGTRLWLGAVCRPQRDKHLARQIMTWSCPSLVVLPHIMWKRDREAVYTDMIYSLELKMDKSYQDDSIQFARFRNRRHTQRSWFLAHRGAKFSILGLLSKLSSTIGEAA